MTAINHLTSQNPLLTVQRYVVYFQLTIKLTTKYHQLPQLYIFTHCFATYDLDLRTIINYSPASHLPVQRHLF